MGPCFKSYLSYKLDWPEMVHDRAKMNWPLIVSGDSGNYFEPWLGKKNLSISNSRRTNDLLVTSSDGLPLSYS